MKDSAQIRVKGDLTEMRFEWGGFDGDDCFGDFQISVTNEADVKRFDFGPCALHGAQSYTDFLRISPKQRSAWGSVTPTFRRCDVHRLPSGYRLVVRFEGNQLHEQVDVFSPLVHIDDEFLKQH